MSLGKMLEMLYTASDPQANGAARAIDELYDMAWTQDPMLDDILRSVDATKLSRPIALALLMATHTSRDNFPARASLVSRVEARLLQERTPEDVEKLLAELR